MSVDRTSTRLTSNSVPQITLRTRISRPLKCTRMRRCSGVRGADGVWAGDRWEWEEGSGGLDEQEWSSCMSHHLIEVSLHTPKTKTTTVNQNETKLNP